MNRDIVLEVVQFPCLSDNYGYLLHHFPTGQTAAIDTPDGAEIRRQLQLRGWNLTHIWNTHHHGDHVGGNSLLKRDFPHAVVYGPATENIPQRTHPVRGGDFLEFGKVGVEIIDVGGHTKGHIAYHIPQFRKLFCGDALFALGCGRMFEGTPEQFWSSLLRLRALPNDTLVYCAHEYTLANARFALSVEPSNSRLVERVAHIQRMREQNRRPTVPSLLGLEKETNPFLRCDFSQEIQKNVGAEIGSSDPHAAPHVFAKVRAAKDKFRG